MAHTLEALLRREGVDLVVDPNFKSRPDVLGDPNCCHRGILLTGRRFAAAEDSWLNVYAAAHEIAHLCALDAGKGWDHDDALWAQQAEILSRWIQHLVYVGGVDKIDALEELEIQAVVEVRQLARRLRDECRAITDSTLAIEERLNELRVTDTLTAFPELRELDRDLEELAKVGKHVATLKLLLERA